MQTASERLSQWATPMQIKRDPNVCTVCKYEHSSATSNHLRTGWNLIQNRAGLCRARVSVTMTETKAWTLQLMEYYDQNKLKNTSASNITISVVGRTINSHSSRKNCKVSRNQVQYCYWSKFRLPDQLHLRKISVSLCACSVNIK
jgi:hypothetical protein